MHLIKHKLLEVSQRLCVSATVSYIKYNFPHIPEADVRVVNDPLSPCPAINLDSVSNCHMALINIAF